MSHHFKEAVLKDILLCQTIEELQNKKVSVLGKKGSLTALLKELSHLSLDQRSSQGKELNEVRDALEEAFKNRKNFLEDKQLQESVDAQWMDVTLSIHGSKKGHIHPLRRAHEQAVRIFSSMGFSLAQGPEIEEDRLNFDALNIPPDHPARQDHDTFYMPSKADGTSMLLRTHTSSVQIRELRKGNLPLKIIAPGRVYRADYDATHTPMFHQIDGVYVGKEITLAHMKGCLEKFITNFFSGEKPRIRLRPSHFPFTEPSCEMDILRKNDKWLEVLGCGMIHPKVLERSGIDPEKHQGFAFGIGLERLTMLKYGLNDLRLFFENDLRWIRHYGFHLPESER